MDFAVLMKAVPALDEVRYDPVERSTVRRDVELFLNPFDQRALQVALLLRRPGERVSVVSLGPANAAGPLRDASVLGADRVLLLSDPRFAGSDTLATARALAAGIHRVGHDVVLGGAWTTDSETGQVGPEVATLLGRRVLTGARAVARDATGPGLTVTVDTPTGWATYRAEAPLVVTVGEKIAKPGKVDPDVRARVPDSAVEVLTLDALSLPPGSVGLAGSPTVVRSVAEDATRRTPVVVAGGSPAERVERAVQALCTRLGPPRAPARAWAPLPDRGCDDREVLVLVTGPDGGLEPGALAVLSEVRRSLPGYWPSAVWVGSRPTAEHHSRLSRAGALGGYLLPLSPATVDSRAAAGAFGLVLDHRPQAAAGVALADAFGRETAAQLAATRSLGLTGDAVAVRAEAPAEIVWSKPSFGGRTVAEITSRTRPSLATVRPGAWEGPPSAGAEARLEWTLLPSLPPLPATRPVDSGTELAADTPSLEEREVVVAVGMGVGGPAGVAALAPLLDRWHAALGATRKVVDAGWVPRQLQVGLTGRALAPRLGVLLGVGGAVNHLVGWKRARALLAVNHDPSAPVFRDVDVGIVGSLAEIVPLLGDAVAPLIGR